MRPSSAIRESNTRLNRLARLDLIELVATPHLMGYLRIVRMASYTRTSWLKQQALHQHFPQCDRSDNQDNTITVFIEEIGKKQQLHAGHIPLVRPLPHVTGPSR